MAELLEHHLTAISQDWDGPAYLAIKRLLVAARETSDSERRVGLDPYSPRARRLAAALAGCDALVRERRPVILKPRPK